MAASLDIKQIAAKFKQKPADVVGLDVDNGCVAAVRLRKAGSGDISVVGADIIDLPATDASVPAGPLALPARLKGKYACIGLASDDAVIKMLTFPGHADSTSDAKIVESLGLDNPDKYRIGYKVIVEGHAKAECRVLAVACPETTAQVGPAFFPAGLPAPFSLEVSGLAAITSFFHAMSEQTAEQAVGIIIFGSKTTTFALTNKNVLSLIRRFNVGTSTLLAKVQDSLGVDRETAVGILTDGAFDISQPVSDVLAPVLKQVVVSRDFVERRENCQVSKLYVAGDPVVSRDVTDEIKSSVGVEVSTWNPLEKMTVAADVLSDNIKGQEWKLVAAAGAALATFEEA